MWRRRFEEGREHLQQCTATYPLFSKLQEGFVAMHNGMDVATFLITPIQRIPRCPALCNCIDCCTLCSL